MATHTREPFRHEALLYDGADDLLGRLVPFVRDGLEADEPVMVAMTTDRVAPLRDALSDAADDVTFVDMAEMGRNPARIIPAWRAFLGGRRPGAGVRGVGEPVWPGRSPAEVAECQLHESLLNLAFTGTDGFWLLCPYDVGGLDASVVHNARCSHPVVAEHGTRGPSRSYREDGDAFGGADAPLSRAPARTEVLSFDRRALRDVRSLAARCAREAGLAEDRVEQYVLAVHEAATNSVLHGGGTGVLRAWREDDAVVCEIRDRGRIEDPLVGRHAPAPDQLGGWGLWLANQLCDLVQIRAISQGLVVRLVVHL